MWEGRIGSVLQKAGLIEGILKTIGFEVSSEKSRGKRGGVSGWSATVEKEILRAYEGFTC